MSHIPSALPARRSRAFGTLSLLAMLLAMLAACSDPAPEPPPLLVMRPGAEACDGPCGADRADGGGVAGTPAAWVAGGPGGLRHAAVTVSRPDGTVLARGPTRDGVVSVFSVADLGPVILSVADDGSGAGVYFDPSTSTWQPLGARVWRAMLPQASAHSSANPLSEAAYRLAVARSGDARALDAAAMADANAAVRALVNARLPLAYHVGDVTQFATAVWPRAVESPADSHAGRFGLLLAAMAHAAQATDGALASPAFAFDDHLQQDLADDGRFNASVDGNPRAYDRRLPFRLRTALALARERHAGALLPEPGPVTNLCHNPALEAPQAAWTLVRRTMNERGSTAIVTERFIAGGVAALPWDLAVTSHTRRMLAQGYDAISEEAIDFDRTSYLGGAGLEVRLQHGYGETGTYCPSDPACYDAAKRRVRIPATVDRTHLLNVGGSFRTRYVEVLSSNFGGGWEPPVRIIERDVTTTFVGFEDVVVPAGTFRGACRFDIVDDGEDMTRESVWITSSGDGLPVQGSVWVLMSGELDGMPVR